MIRSSHASHFSTVYSWNSEVYQHYSHKVPVILHDNLGRESHKSCGAPTPVTWLLLPLLLLRKQTNTGITTVSLQKHTDPRAHDFAHFPPSNNSLSLLTLTCAKDGHFVELLLLYSSLPSQLRGKRSIFFFSSNQQSEYLGTLSAEVLALSRGEVPSSEEISVVDSINCWLMYGSS